MYYYEYEFLDVALDTTLLTFEMALKIRYREITGEKFKKKKKDKSEFICLIEWGTNQELFEDDEPVIHSLRRLRNMTSHPENHRLAGPTSLDIIHRIAEVINGLYEDVNLRKARKREESKVNTHLQKIIENGAVLEFNNKRLIIFKAELLQFKNWSNPNNYHILFWPIFDPVEKNGKIDTYDPFLFSFTDYKFEGDSFYVYNKMYDKEAKLLRIVKPENDLKFREWKTEFEKSAFSLKFFIDMRIAAIKSRIRAQRNDEQ